MQTLDVFSQIFKVEVVSSVMLVYLLYLSMVDFKYQKLEYAQTALTYLFASTVLVTMACEYTAFTPEFYSVLLSGLIAFVISFVFMLIFSLIKIKGNNAFGGADIWVTAAIMLALGIDAFATVILTTCISFCVFVLIRKVITKNNTSKIPFVPFLTIGYIAGITLYFI